MPVFVNELHHFARQWYLYLIGLILFSAAALSMWGMAAEAPDASQVYNSAYRLCYMGNYFSVLLLFLLPTTVGAVLYRDYRSRMYRLLYAYPLAKGVYLRGKLAASLLVVFMLGSSIGLGFAVGAIMPGTVPGVLVPFDTLAYGQLLVYYIFPNLLLTGALVFAVVVRTRNIYLAFLSVLFLVIWQVLIRSLLTGDELGYWAALFDPTGETAIHYTVRYWTLAQKNTLLLPLSGVLLYNRILWLAIAVGVLGWAYRHFDFHQFVAERQKKQLEEKAVNVSPVSVRPSVQFDFNRASSWRTAWATSAADFRYITFSWPFMTLLASAFLVVYFQQHQLNPMYGFEILPTTGRMLQMPMFFFGFIINLLTFLYVGLLEFRGQKTRMDALIDVCPQSNSTHLLSRWFTVLRMQILLLTLVMLAGVLAQAIQGYYRFELWHYAYELLVLQLIHFLIWSSVAFLIHATVKNMYLGFFLLLLLPTALSGLPVAANMLGWDFLRQSVLQFNQVPGKSIGFFYSDLNGYGSILPSYFAYKLYWSMLALLMLLLSLLVWKRGLTFSWRERWQQIKSRWVSPLRWGVYSVGGIFILTGGWLYYQENYRAYAHYNSSKQELLLVRNERLYGHLIDMVQPRLAKAYVEMDMYPQERDFKASGQLWFVNRSANMIDTIVVTTSMREQTDISVHTPHRHVVNDSLLRLQMYVLSSPLAHGDSLQLSFSVRNYPATAIHNHSRMLTNGSFINRNVLPTLGVRAMFLTQESKRSTYGLPARPKATYLPTDTTLLDFAFANNDMERIDFETVVSTAADQEAIAMGQLQRVWVANGRRFAHYRSQGPLPNNIAWLSGQYTKRYAQSDALPIILYHHPEHGHNISDIEDGMKAALAYCTDWFGPLLHDTLRLVEYPLTEGTHATLQGNLVPYSEALFLCKVDTDSEVFNMPFYIAAHEVAHYWWGHRVDPANVQGGKLVTEALAEYLAMQAIKHAYGERVLDSFRKNMYELFLQQRARAGNEEPLIYAKDHQEYLLYRKGGLAFYALSQLWGEAELNECLAAFVEKYEAGEPPFATSLDLLSHLQAAMPLTLHYLLDDYFNVIRYYDARITDVAITQLPDHRYQVVVNAPIGLHSYDATGVRLDTLSSVGHWIELAYFNDEELIRKERVPVNKANRYETSLPVPPNRVVIDPTYYLFEEQRNDNEWRQ